jgi:hypothetical protein
MLVTIVRPRTKKYFAVQEVTWGVHWNHNVTLVFTNMAFAQSLTALNIAGTAQSNLHGIDNIMSTACPDARPFVSFTADNLPNLSGKYIPPTVEFASIVPLRQRITRLAPWGCHRIAGRIANTLIGQEFLDW